MAVNQELDLVLISSICSEFPLPCLVLIEFNSCDFRSIFIIPFNSLAVVVIVLVRSLYVSWLVPTIHTYWIICRKCSFQFKVQNKYNSQIVLTKFACTQQCYKTDSRCIRVKSISILMSVKKWSICNYVFFREPQNAIAIVLTLARSIIESWQQKAAISEYIKENKKLSEFATKYARTRIAIHWHHSANINTAGILWREMRRTWF